MPTTLRHTLANSIKYAFGPGGTAKDRQQVIETMTFKLGWSYAKCRAAVQGVVPRVDDETFEEMMMEIS